MLRASCFMQLVMQNLMHLKLMQNSCRSCKLFSNLGPRFVDLNSVSYNHLHKLHVLHHQRPAHEVLHHLNGDKVDEGAKEPVDDIDGALGNDPLPQHCTAQAANHGFYKMFPRSSSQRSHFPQLGDDVKGLDTVGHDRQVGEVLLDRLQEGNDAVDAGRAGHLDMDEEDDTRERKSKLGRNHTQASVVVVVAI